MEKKKTKKNTSTNRTTNKKKVNRKKKETIDISLEAIVYFMMSIIIFLSLYTKLLSDFGTMMKYVFVGQFAKIAFIIPLILMWIAILKFRNAKNITQYYLIQILLLVALTLLYGSVSFGISFPEKIDIELIKKVFVESIIGDNIGIWTYLATYLASKLIGKLGMLIVSIAILGFIAFRYTNLSLEDFRIKINDFFDLISKNIKKIMHDFNNKEERTENKKIAKTTANDEKIDSRNIHNIPNKSNDFDFLKKYKKEISEMPDFSFDDERENNFVEATTSSENNIDNADYNLETNNISNAFNNERDDFLEKYSDEYIDEVLFSNNKKNNEEDSTDRTKIYKNLSEKIREAEENILEDTSKNLYSDNFFQDKITEERDINLDNNEIEEKIVDLRDIYTKDRKEKENIEALVIEESSKVVKKTNKYTLPSINLLKKYAKKESNDAQNLRDIEKLESTLRIFGVEAKVVNVSKGPTITRFELQPKMGVKVSKILNLSDDLSLALAAVAPIRIEAPIPGTSLIGIEVPNAKTDIVSFREIIETGEFSNSKGKLPITLGKDVSGKAIIDDIAKMPHLLVAGSTGSGKSVCINTLICSILFKSSPEDVKMIMIDPKMVELSVYNDIPHLLVPVVTDMKKAPYALSWAVNEMNNRYKLLAENRVRDIEGYNEIHKDEKLPRIVVIVDELADLMMVSPNEVEDAIIRLAQKARACGIHLVIATQRPSVDVITGLIKANIPTRIAFAVSSQIDSRTILDQAGAEKLIGKGDMLYYHPSQAKPHRIQGPFISDDEVNNMVDFLSKQNYSEKNVIQSDIIEETIKTTVENQKKEDRDELLDSVIDFVQQNTEVSTSLIQRRFRIGYNRASRIIDELEEMGIVSESNGAKGRKVLSNLDE